MSILKKHDKTQENQLSSKLQIDRRKKSYCNCCKSIHLSNIHAIATTSFSFELVFPWIIVAAKSYFPSSFESIAANQLFPSIIIAA